MAPVNVLTATATDLSELLDNGTISSQDLIKLYLKQIEAHNHEGIKLNALISVESTEDLLRHAKTLDEERALGKPRSKLHGIPIIIKDTICTRTMGTTCGSYSLLGAVPIKEASIITKLISAGLIILGKANLSEHAGFKGINITGGWSAMGGQTQNPYVVGGVIKGERWLGDSTPGGSSSGSASGVAAGFAPLSIGTETDGSITDPADRHSLYSIKLSSGSLPMDGVQPITSFSDTLGIMAKSAKDLAALLQVMTGKNYSEDMSGSWEGLRVGAVDYRLWKEGLTAAIPNPAYNEQKFVEYAEAAARIRAAGGSMKDDVVIRPFAREDDDLFDEIIYYDMPIEIGEYLKNFQNTTIKSLEDIIAFNKAHSDRALPPEQPSQQTLITAVETHIPESKIKNNRLVLRKTYKEEGLDKTLAENDIDVVFGPNTGRIAAVAACAGYCTGTLPLGYAKFNGRAFGLTMVAPSGREDLLLRVASAWEATFPPRKPPPQLV